MHITEEQIIKLKELFNAHGFIDNPPEGGYDANWDSAAQSGFDQALRIYDPVHAESMAGKQPSSVEQLGYVLAVAAQEGITLGEARDTQNGTPVVLETPLDVEPSAEEVAAADARQEELAAAAAAEQSLKDQAAAAEQKAKEEAETAQKAQDEQAALEQAERDRVAAEALAEANKPAAETTETAKDAEGGDAENTKEE